MFCPKCGANIPDDSVFCPECGEKIESIEAAKAPQVEPEKKPLNSPISKAEEYNSVPQKPEKKGPVVAIIAVLVIVLVIVGAVNLAKKGREARLAREKETTTSVAKSEGSFDTKKESANPDTPSKSDSSEASVSVSLDTEGIDGIVDLESARSVERMQEIASNLSTSNVATAEEFGWFFDLEAGFNTGEADFIRNGEVERLSYDSNLMLEGGWSGFLADTISKPFDPMVERFFTVEIESEGTDFAMTLSFDTVFFPHDGETYEETDVVSFAGTWDPVSGTASAKSDYLKVEFDNFYISEDELSEIATGTFTWNSGEVERIALMRYNR